MRLRPLLLGAAIALVSASAATAAGLAGPAPPGTGLNSTIGTSLEPQIVRVGSSLREVNPSHPSQFLNGKFRFTGVDAYELATDWSINGGCGSDLSDSQMLNLFQALGPDSVVRAWFFQALATNKYSGQLDFTGIDRVVNLASRAGVHLIATLANQDGTCDDNTWKNPSWYSSGYMTAAGDKLSFQTWAETVAARYQDEPAILAWEPMNEPRPDTCANMRDCWDHRVCPSNNVARDALRSFFDRVGVEIRSADRNHLISDGAPPVGGCGTLTWTDLQYVDSSPGIDLMSLHDYTGATPLSVVTAGAYSRMASAIHKPVFAGENGGLNAVPATLRTQACPGLSQRASRYGDKIAAEFSSLPALTGWLFWNAGPPPATRPVQVTCQYGTWQGDPLLDVLMHKGASARSNR